MLRRTAGTAPVALAIRLPADDLPTGVSRGPALMAKCLPGLT